MEENIQENSKLTPAQQIISSCAGAVITSLMGKVQTFLLINFASLPT